MTHPEQMAQLAVEHTVLERMMQQAKTKSMQMKLSKRTDFLWARDFMDFMKTYADRAHHGKEEGLLFQRLVKKGPKPQHITLVRELIDEHIQIREKVSRLEGLALRADLSSGSERSEFIVCLQDIYTFYMEHIKKEDTYFYPICGEYFTSVEWESMSHEMQNFDCMVLQEKYKKLADMPMDQGVA
jgi:hemerythrin-like domain-containing protein